MPRFWPATGLNACAKQRMKEGRSGDPRRRQWFDVPVRGTKSADLATMFQACGAGANQRALPVRLHVDGERACSLIADARRPSNTTWLLPGAERGARIHPYKLLDFW